MLSIKRLEKLFGLLLPPASREHVLGDLHERYKSPRHYIADAVSVLGPVIISRIRRTTDFQGFLMEAVSVYVSLSTAAWCLGRRAFLYEQGGFFRLAIPTVVTLVALLICNAYADPGKHAVLMRPILQSTGSLSLAFLGQAAIFNTRPSLAVPFEIMLVGNCIGLVLLSTLRTFFPTVQSDQAKVAPVNSPRTVERPPLFPQRQISESLDRRIRSIQLPPKFKAGALFASFLAFLLLAMLSTRVATILSPPHVLIVVVIVLVLISGHER